MFRRIPEVYSEFYNEMSNKCHDQSSGYSKNHNENTFFVPTLLRGEELFTQMGFFVQLILTYRYNLHTEL